MVNEEFIPVSEPLLNGRELEYVTECIQSGWVSSLGKFINEFEQRFAEFCGTRFAVATNNGTTALHLALATLGIGPGDEVIIPTLTFIATANAVRYTGATPVFADSESSTWNIDPEKIFQHITPHTKAIIPVHLYGHPADMDPILELASQYNLSIIEDAAEAHGALYKNKRVGSLGLMSAFSFYANKIITSGEGGMVTTNDSVIAERLRFLRDHAMSPEKRYWHPEIGYNYRMTNLQAALGVAQMERIEEFITKKRWVADQYFQRLRGVEYLQLPTQANWASSVYWMYSVLIKEGVPVKRDEVISYLKSQNIDSRPFFYPIHTMPPYHANISLPIAEKLSGQGINLPSAVTLNEEKIDRIVSALKHWM
jgi:perosamine synthetase